MFDFFRHVLEQQCQQSISALFGFASLAAAVAAAVATAVVAVVVAVVVAAAVVVGVTILFV